MSAKLNSKIIHNQCEAHDGNFRYKIGLANWEIRPWIAHKKKRFVVEKVFFTKFHAIEKIQNCLIHFGFSDLIKLIVLFIIFTTNCSAQDISSTER